MLFPVVITTIAMASTLESRGITPTLRKLMDAICIVESNCDPSAIGDNGNAIGAYQIWRDYWFDACTFDDHDDLQISDGYESCYNKSYSEKIVRAYMNRYATKKRIGRPVTDEDRARIHNGGPNGFKYTSTKIFWTKVKNQLDG